MSHYYLSRDMVPKLRLEQDITEPDDTAFEVRRIEIDFAHPVTMTEPIQRLLCDIVQAMAKATETPEMVHWQAGCGSKPIWNEPHEPTFDDSVYHIETFARERYESEPFTTKVPPKP